jgi:GntR family transcriptional regulator/MocR family aminotransferase
VHTARGIEAEPSETIVFNISLTAVALLFKLLTENGDTIAVEDPGYGAIKQLSKSHDLRLVAIPVDAQGIDIEILNQQHPAPRIVYVTPAHQDPTGTTMSLLRRQALLQWAQKNDSFIIEDDFDSYFSYSGAQIPTLKALDTDDRVIYVSTFWQILYPLTTASFIVAPPSLIPALLRGKALSEGVAEAMLQTTLAEMLNSGYLQAHTRKWNNTFAARRRSALFQFKKAFGAALEIQNDCGGLNMPLRLAGIEHQLVMNAAREADLPLVDIFSLFENNPDHLYLLHFAGASESQMTTKIIDFHRLLRLRLVTER